MTQTLAADGAEADGSRRLMIVLNPAAGRRRFKKLDAVMVALATANCRVTVSMTRAPGEAEEAAASANANDVDVIVAAGGDGTINEVANGLAKNQAPPVLGIIPLGTTNVFAIELGIRNDPQQIASVLARATPTAIYPGRVEGRLFLVMAGVGFDARVVAGVNLGLKRILGKGAYVVQSLVELARGQKAEVHFRARGHKMAGSSLIVAKGRYYGGGFVIAPDANIARPDFELCIVRDGRRRAVLRQALALGLGRFDDLDEVRTIQAEQLDIMEPRGQPVQADGDIVALTPVSIDIAPAPLMVLRP